MTGQYIDFAPTKRGGGVVGAKQAVGGGVRTVRAGAVKTTVPKPIVKIPEPQGSRGWRGARNTTAKSMEMVRTEAAKPVRSVGTGSVGTRPVGTRSVGTRPVNARNTTAKPVSVRPVKSATRSVATGNVTRNGAATYGVVSGTRGGLSMDNSNSKVKLGEVKDLNLNQKFVKTDVPKRPLGSEANPYRDSNVGQDEVTKAKSRRIGGRLRVRKAAYAAESQKVTDKANAGFNVPNSPFINQDKVVKRPLSKNVYQKQTEMTPTKEPDKAVKIIAKPKKESHVGVVVTVILTIILGAVAGTVAFLLLPR